MTAEPIGRAATCPGEVRQSFEAYNEVFCSAGGRISTTPFGRSASWALYAALYEAPPYEMNLPSLPVFRLSVNLTRAVVQGGLSAGEERRYLSDCYTLFLTPPGAVAQWRKDVPSRHINIYWNAEAFDCEGGDDVPLAQTSPVLNLSLPGARPLIDQLASELGRPSFLGSDAVHGLAKMLLVKLARHTQDLPASDVADPAELMARLREFIGANLCESIRVADLEAQAELSPSKFAQLCQQQTGQSPHQFVLSERLAHACKLLRNSSLSLADVAGACGFADQQHLTNVMRRNLGATPGRYRALHRPEIEPGN